MRRENISQPNIPLLTILKYTSLVYDRVAAGYRSAPPVGCKTAARAIDHDSEDTCPLYGAIRSLYAEPHIKTGWKHTDIMKTYK